MDNLNDNQEGFSFQLHHTIQNLEAEVRSLKIKIQGYEVGKEIQQQHYDNLRKEFNELDKRHKELIAQTIRILTEKS